MANKKSFRVVVEALTSFGSVVELCEHDFRKTGQGDDGSGNGG
jgi:hypothetical protein